MREALQPYLGQRIQITAPVQRLGTRIGWTGLKEPTVLLGPIVDAQGHELADRLWLPLGRRLGALNPQPGDVLRLVGRVRAYTRHRRQYHGTEIRLESDLGLAYPTRCAVMAPAGIAETVRDSVPTPDPVSATGARLIRALPTPAASLPARARLLFALAVLSLEEPGPISLTQLNARANVPPIAFLAQLKKLGSAGIVRFTPSGRVLLTHRPTQPAIGVAQ